MSMAVVDGLEGLRPKSDVRRRYEWLGGNWSCRHRRSARLAGTSGPSRFRGRRMSPRHRLWSVLSLVPAVLGLTT